MRSIGPIRVPLAALFLSGAAVAALIGPASSDATKSSTWGTGVEAILPADALVGTGQHVAINSISCSSAGNCTAVGTYLDSTSTEQAMMLTETAGTWSAGVEPTLPSDASAFGGYAADLESVSCASPGNCTAVGAYVGAPAGSVYALILTQADGTWQQGVGVALPVNAASDEYSSLNSVSCSSEGNCTAVGSYDIPGSPSLTVGLLVTESAGSWQTGVEAPLPDDASSSSSLAAWLASVSCSSPGNCAAVGYYDSPNGGALLLQEAAGNWTASEVTLPANATAGRQAVLDTVSCASIGNCSAAGTYIGPSYANEALVVTETNGTWGTGVEAGLPPGADEIQYLEAISCSSPGNCGAVGSYFTSSGSQRGLLLTETAGTWAAGEAAPLPADALSDPEVELHSVSCPSDGNCSAVGSYAVSANVPQALVVIESGGAWSSGVAPSYPADGYDPNPSGRLESVSCASATECGASGEYLAYPNTYYPEDGQKGLLASTLTPPVDLTVSKSGTGSGAISSTPAAIDCGLTCGASFAAGTSVTLSETPETGSAFVGWSGDCTGTGTCAVMMDQARSVTAEFDLVPEGLMVTTSGAGSGAVTSAPGGISCGSTCAHSYAYGTSVTLTAVAAAGSSFVGWSGDCAGTGGCMIAMSQARSVTANFDLVPQALTVSKSGAGSGMVTSAPHGINCGSACSHSYAYGTSVTLTATAALGSRFAGWSRACRGRGGCTVTMSKARAVTATFAIRPPVTLKVSRSGRGSGTVRSTPPGINCGSTCSHAYSYGTAITLTARATQASVFIGWSGACTGSTATCHVSMTAARATTARFSVTKLLTVAKAGVGGGQITSSPSGISCPVACTRAFVAGTIVTLTASANAGSKFVGWSGACSGTRSCVVRMSITRKVKATFTRTAAAHRTRRARPRSGQFL
jgi:Divergent InlB B-repeat domain